MSEVFERRSTSADNFYTERVLDNGTVVVDLDHKIKDDLWVEEFNAKRLSRQLYGAELEVSEYLKPPAEMTEAPDDYRHYQGRSFYSVPPVPFRIAGIASAVEMAQLSTYWQPVVPVLRLQSPILITAENADPALPEYQADLPVLVDLRKLRQLRLVPLDNQQ